MAPRKRPGPFDTDDESVDDGSAQSLGSHTSSRKRQRTSSLSSEASNHSSIANGDRAVSTPPSEIASGVDDPDEAGDNDEESYAKEAEAEDASQIGAEDAEFFATQRAERRDRDQSDDCGILESVAIENFMCHKNYVFALGPRINFICGKNGSGKSAILTAIVLCLGGKASQTNRASSLKDLIRQGQDHCSITCKVKNVGDGSYQQEEYGDSIIIERHFSRAGTAGFKLKNSRGRIVSTKRADLDAICDHFGFQVENPMSVLSQDLARQFITSSSAAEKYRLFVKGVLLEQLDQDYCIIEQNVSTFEPKIEVAKKDLDDLKNIADAAKNKAEQSQKYDTMKDQFREWRRQLVWEQVRLKELDRDDYAREIKIADEKIAAAQAHVEELDTAFQELTTKRDTAKQAWEQADTEVQSVKDEKKEEEVKQKEAKRLVSDAQAEQRNVRQLLNEAIKTIESKDQEIDAEEARLSEVDGGGAARRLRELREAEIAVPVTREEEKAHAAQREPLKAKLEEAARAQKKAEEMVGIQEKEVQQQSERLAEIRKESGVQDATYDRQMPQLLRAIQQERRFQNRPIGPLGKHVKLLYPEWSSILEKSFGSILNAFVVTSKSDQDLLTPIVKRIASKIQVFIAPPGPINLTTEPDQGFLTVLRALEIDNPTVLKILVMQNYIDNTALIHDHAEASRTLFPESGPGPKNLPRCYCFHPTKKTKGFLLSRKGGRPAQDPIDQWNGLARMRSSVEDQIRIQQGVLDDAKEQLLEFEKEARSCRNTHERMKQETVRFRRTAGELKIKVQEAERLVEELNDAIKDDDVKSGNLEVLKQMRKEAEQQKELHEGSFMEATTNLDEKKKAMRAYNVTLSRFDERIDELSRVASTRKTGAQTADKDREHALGEKNAAVARVDDGRNDRGTMDRQMEKIDKVLQEAVAQANGAGSQGRVNFPEGETFASLSAKFDRRRKELQNVQKKLGGSHEELEAEKARTATNYAQSKKDVDELKLLSDSLTETMHNRRKRWFMFQRFISVSAKFNFGFLLSERGFRGQLLLDHEQHLLDLRVEPDVTRKSGRGRQANTLSGGEKSFSQICLLLAIWEAMGSPIRCLDEFDVYMDAVNRSRSASLLIEGARTSTGKQFILISPGSKNDIPIAQDVHSIEVKAAERGQGTLTF